jgi:hypothetical protein
MSNCHGAIQCAQRWADKAAGEYGRVAVLQAQHQALKLAPRVAGRTDAEVLRESADALRFAAQHWVIDPAGVLDTLADRMAHIADRIAAADEQLAKADAGSDRAIGLREQAIGLREQHGPNAVIATDHLKNKPVFVGREAEERSA